MAALARCGPTARHVSGFSEGGAPEGTPQRLYPHSLVSLKERRLTNYEIDRDVGEPDAIGRLRSDFEAAQRSDTLMIANDATTRAVTQNGAELQRSRASLVALWLTQVALALMFLMAGGSKLAGVPAMVSLFDQVGVGQWFRYVTGIIELTGGIALLIPSAAVFGAMLLIATMIGAIIVNVFVVPASPVPPLVLLLLAATVAWARRDQIRIF
jgi:putative oxidoreductase